MRIEKIKLQGKGIYPATIAAAVKDANFRDASDDHVMTQGEINLYFNTQLDGVEDILKEINGEG